MIHNYQIAHIINKNSINIFFGLCSYCTFIVLYLTYDITLSPDFEKYYSYYLYYNSGLEATNLDQGHIYYFLSYIFTLLFRVVNPTLSTNELLNISIHFFNNFIFFIALVGFNKLLLQKKYTKGTSFLVLVATIFLPATIALRLSFKPEILALLLTGWILYYLDKYYETSSSNYAMIIILLLSILFSSKISIAFMFGLLLIYLIFNNYRNLINKKLFKQLLSLILIFSILSIENYFHNDKLFYQVEHNENYNNKASSKFFTNLDYKNLKNNPNRYFHSQSFTAITLFDTFNDFFLLYWNSEYTELNKDRRDFFTTVTVKNDSISNLRYEKDTKQFRLTGNYDERWLDKDYVNETRMRFSFIFSIIFYLGLILFSLFNRRLRPYLSSVFIGILAVSISALGLFGTNNFDPLVGDSVKTFYYGFFITLSFIFFLSEFLRNIKFGKKTITFLLLLLFLFFIGFPFTYSFEVIEGISYKNSYLPFCNFNKFLLTSIFTFNSEINCNLNSDDIKNILPIRILDEENFKLNFSKIPYINMLLLMSIFYYALFSNKISNKKDN